tara:strand:+ start:92 stop:268 length:177 start_codon:yes stop_codon:yes gene_type:complete
MIRLFIVILILLNSCSLDSKKNVSKRVDFDNFYNLSIDEYKQKLNDYNKSTDYPNIDK